MFTLKFAMKCYLTGSVTSLAAGLFFGLLAAVGAYLASQNPKNVWLSLGEQQCRLNCNGTTTDFYTLNGVNCSSSHVGTSGTLAVVMGLRFLNSGKFMPAGLMTLLR